MARRRWTPDEARNLILEEIIGEPDSDDAFNYEDLSSSDIDSSEDDESTRPKRSITKKQLSGIEIKHGTLVKFKKRSVVITTDALNLFERLHIGKSGPKDIPDNCTTYFDYFKLYFSEDLMDIIVNAINQYVQKNLRTEKMEKFSHIKNWKDTNVAEMYSLIGLVINMSSVIQPTMEDFGSTERNRRIEIFSLVMPLERFQILYYSMLRVCEVNKHNPSEDETTVLIVQHLVQSFQKYFSPFEAILEKHLALGAKKRLPFRRIFPMDREPTESSVIVKAHSDSATGYLLNIAMIRDQEDNSIRRLSKTTKPLFYWLLQSSVINSYLLCKLHNPTLRNKLSLLKFKDELVSAAAPIPPEQDDGPSKHTRLATSRRGKLRRF